MSSEMTTAFGTAIASVKTDVMGMIVQALPVALAIVGTVLAITIGIKVFKRFSK